MGYLCATCGGIGGLFETSHAHSDKDSCVAELRAKSTTLTQKLESAKKENALLEEEGMKLIDAQILRAECAEAALKAAELQLKEISKRIYKIGLTCDKVLGLEHGFCPDVGEPRDNLTRIKIAVERFTEKRVDEVPCAALDATGTLCCEKPKGHDGNHRGDNGLNNREWFQR